jgi:hypothetical protein
LEKNEKKFDLFGIQTHPIPLNPHGLRANRTSPNLWISVCVGGGGGGIYINFEFHVFTSRRD